MKRVKFILLASIMILSFESKAQITYPSDMTYDKTTLGLGFGQDYGGIGANISLYPSRNFGLFGSVGHAFAGMGYNVGVKLRAVPKRYTNRTSPFISAMYGYNAAIAVTDGSQFNKLFYGTSIGFGFDYRSRPFDNNSHWSFAVLIPIRGNEVDDYIDDLKNNHGVEFKNDLLPISFSIGYRFAL